jgi:release factor glutamine methyltransferase
LDTWTILKVLDWTRGHFEAKGLESPRLDAELILAEVLKIQRVMLYARFDQPLGGDELAKIRGLVARRAKREPLAYLLGKKEFWSLDFEVTPATLIPRPDTETLVEVALRRLKGRAAPRVADVGTGSGCVAIAIAKELADAQVSALEIAEATRAVAQRNVDKHQLGDRVEVLSSDLLSGIGDRRFDLIVANLPYIRSDEWPTLMPDVRDFEPRLALESGEDGLVLIRRLIGEAASALSPDGSLALEAAPAQASTIRGALEAAGYVEIATENDDAGLARVTHGRRRAT